MTEKTRSLLRWLVIFTGLACIGILCGCSIFGLNDGVEELIGQGPGKSGSANVRMQVVIPGRNNILPTIRASGTGAEVTVKLTLLQPGSQTNPVLTLLKVATVQADGSAEASFSSIPAGSAVGELFITGGNIGGKTAFHGASDLFPGNNVMTVSPKGSRDESDVLANALLYLAATPKLVTAAKPNLVTNTANAAGSLLSSTSDNIYAEVYNRLVNSPTAFDSNQFTQVNSSFPDGSISGGGLATWTITPDQIWSGTPLSGAGLLPISVPRAGVGDFALIAWQNLAKTSFALSKISPTTGALLFYLQAGSSNGFQAYGGQAILGDGSVVAAGINAGKPALVRWDGKSNVDLTAGVNVPGLIWNTSFEISSVGGASATVSYLEYDPSGTGRILCNVNDPLAGPRSFSVNPANGTATEIEQNNVFGLWAQAASGSLLLQWDPIDAAASYAVYWATGTAIATSTAPSLAINQQVLLLENLSNGVSYTCQISAIASDGRTLAWSNTATAVPLGAADPVMVSTWKLATTTFEIGSTAMSNVKILSVGLNEISVEVTGTVPFMGGSVIVGLNENSGVMLKVAQGWMPPGGTGQPPIGSPPVGLPPVGPSVLANTTPVTMTIPVVNVGMEEVFAECKYVFRGKMSQLPTMSESLLTNSDPMYQKKMSYLRPPALRNTLRAGFTSSIAATATANGLSLNMDNFAFDPDVVVQFESSWGRIAMFEMRVDGYASCDIYAKLVASTGLELTALEGTLLQHTEIPFFIGPVPGTWAREVTGAWKYNLNAAIEVKAGTKFRVDFRSGVHYNRELGWDGQLLWRVKNEPMIEGTLKGTFSNEANLEIKNSLKVGGLAGPEIVLKPYIKSEATISSEKPCQIDAALSMGLQGELKAIVQAWSYTIGEWSSTFEPFGPWVIASHSFTTNATPTLIVTGPYDIENQMNVSWPDGQQYFPHVYTTTGTDSIYLTMDDSKGSNNGIRKVEVSVDGEPAFMTFDLSASFDEYGLPILPDPVIATLSFKLPITIDKNMIDRTGTDPKWYTPFRLPSGPHELEFKVYDKCGDFSIATHAVWIKQEEPVWKVKDSLGNVIWEIGVNGFERGNLPARERAVAPIAVGFDVSPMKNGLVKHFAPDGSIILEGAFTNNVRSGIWKEKWAIEGQKNCRFQTEFGSSGEPVSWINEEILIDPSIRTRYLEIQPIAGGNSSFSIKTDDIHYLYPDFRINTFSTGVRTLGVVSEGRYTTETFVNGIRSGAAEHSLVQFEKGEYFNNRKNGIWLIKAYNSPTELYSSFEANLQAGILEGQFSYSRPTEANSLLTGYFSNGLRSGDWVYTSDEKVIHGSYLNGKAHGLFTFAAANGYHYSGNFSNGSATALPWVAYDSSNVPDATMTEVLDPIMDGYLPPIPNSTAGTLEADQDWLTFF